MGLLYVSPNGTAWRKHSYSAGRDFDQSPYKYYLRRILGWRESDRKSAFKFGRAFEESIQFHHDNNGQGALEDFKSRWLVFKDDIELKYTVKEKNWENLNRIGSEMIRLYQIKQPTLPIPLGGGTVFQREYSKEVFPQDINYGEIEFAGKLDIVSYVQPDHPLLPKVNWKPEYGPLRPVIIDIKTSGVNYHERQGMASFDNQLRAYSWLTGIRTVALLWFTKTGHKLDKGSSVTVLEDARTFKAGDEAVVAQDTDAGVYLVTSDYFLTEMEAAQGRKADGKLDTTKAAGERKANWLEANATLVPGTFLTRQRLQFNAGIVTPDSAEDAGRIAGDQIVGIANSWKNKSWRNKFDSRPPFGDSNDSYFRAFCLDDTNFREQNFSKNDSDLDDLFQEEAEQEL